MLYLPLTDVYWPTPQAVAAYGLAPLGKPAGVDYVTIDLFDVKEELYDYPYQTTVYP